MSWLQLVIRAHRHEWKKLEPALEELGALSVTLLDAEDHPILEPGVGETPLWPELNVEALFDEGIDERGLIAALAELAPAVARDRIDVRAVADADWTRAWMDRYEPMRFGARLWIYPTTIEPPESDEDVVVRLDPGLAFGTGTHPTTALCLEWLDSLALDGATVVDYGCGSGVLAIAALKLGAARAIGIDNDPQALVASRDNAQRNGVADRLELHDAAPPGLAGDVVVANILAGALVDLAPVLLAAAKPGAPIALSGILREQADEVLAAYDAECDDLGVTAKEDWVRVDGRRKLQD